MRISKSIVFTAASFGMVIPHMGYAESSRHIGFAGSPFELYGQLNFGVFDFDDGTDRKTKFLDNDNSNSRVGLWYRNSLSNGSTLKFNLETALGFEESDGVDINDDDFDWDLKRTNVRHVEGIFETPTYGTFYLGQGSMSADGITEADFSGTGLIAYVSISDSAGGIQFREKNEDTFGPTVGSGFSPLDGARRLRFRYDTPAFYGITFSASYGEEWLDQSNENDYTDIAARYSGNYGDLKVDARLGYQWIDVDDGKDEEIVAGSVAVMHTPTGLSGALAGGSADENDRDYWYAKLGYQRDWFSIGTTHLSVDYYDGDDFSAKGSDSKSWAIAVVQNIDRFNVEVYAAYRNYDFDLDDNDFEDVDMIAIGARWKF